LTPSSVLCVDDHPIVRRGLVDLVALDPDFVVVGEAADGPGALDLIGRRAPDIAVVDVRMPDMDGIALTRRIAAVAPATRVLLLSSFSPGDVVRAAYAAGAWGYLLKDSPFEAILDALRRIRSGLRAFPPDIANRLGEALIHPLTMRERAVLDALQSGRSNKEIGRDLGISEGTARTHVQNLLGKLGVSSRAKAVALAQERGLFLSRD
jgi:DNA-binding NarL/FixJ family response regulator